MHTKDADRIANSVDPDQTAPLRAVWSKTWSTLFALTCLSEILGSLQNRLFVFLLFVYGYGFGNDATHGDK